MTSEFTGPTWMDDLCLCTFAEDACPWSARLVFALLCYWHLVDSLP